MKRTRCSERVEAKRLSIVRKSSKSSYKKKTRPNVPNTSDSDGVLNDEICCYCGVEILDPAEFSTVLICDACNGDFHLKCSGEDVIPRKSKMWICPLCKEDSRHFSALKFNVSDEFLIPRKKRSANEVLYSPARPLDLAFEECKEKGLMLVRGLLSHDTMKFLTHGDIIERTSSGRVTETWYGVIGEVAKRVGGGVCSNMVFREGRYDITLPTFVTRQLGLEEALSPVLERLKSIMGTPTPQIRTHNVVFVPIGSPSQEWHFDDARRHHGTRHRYFTILVHLNIIDEDCGGTEIRRQGVHDLVRGRPGDAFVFNGSIEHRGLENVGQSHRFFYYCSFACGADGNV